MKFIISLVAVAGAIYVHQHKDQPYKSPTDQELMDEILGGTVFSRDHNKFTDQAFLHDVFAKYTDPEATGEDRGLNLWNAKYAAKEILREWKGMSSEDLQDYVESEKFGKIFKEFDYRGIGVLDNKNMFYWARKMAGEEFEGAVSSEGM